MNPRTAILAATCLVTSTTAQITQAQVQAETSAIAAPRSATLELATGEHKLRELIDEVAKFLGHNYLCQEQDFQNPNANTLTLQNPLRLNQTACEQVFSQLLYSKQFAVVPISETAKIYEIVNMAGSRRGEIRSRSRTMTPAEVLANREWIVMVTTTVRLEYIDAQRATATLRPFFSASNSSCGGLTPGNVGNGESLLLQGFAPAVAAAIELLERADVPAGKQTPSIQSRLKALEARVKQLGAKLDKD